MIKRLVKHGNSYALIIDKAILELLKITPETDIEVVTNGDALVLQPRRNGHVEVIDDDELEVTLDSLESRYESVFRSLAKGN